MSADEFYEVLDARFARLFNGSGRVHKLFGGCQWAEGPAWFGAGRYLVWSLGEWPGLRQDADHAPN